jgi:hypothetical protein
LNGFILDDEAHSRKVNYDKNANPASAQALQAKWTNQKAKSGTGIYFCNL